MTYEQLVQLVVNLQREVELLKSKNTADVFPSTEIVKRKVRFNDAVCLSTNAGITADTGSAQGDGEQTFQIIEIATCANAGDAITLPSAEKGRVVIVINHGAQASDVFPASGDKINEGTVDVATSCAVNETLLFIAYDSTNWECLALARN